MEKSKAKMSAKIRAIFHLNAIFWRNNKTLFIYNIVHAIIVNPAISLIDVVIIQKMIEGIESREPFKEVLLRIAFFLSIDLALLCGQLVIAYLYVDKASKKLKRSISKELFEYSLNIDYSNFDNPDYYDHYVWVEENLANVILNSNQILCGILSSVFTIISVYSLVFSIAPFLVMISIVQAVIVLVIRKKLVKLTFQRDQEYVSVDRKRDYYSRLFRDRNAIDELKSTNLFEIIAHKYDENWEEEKKLIKKYARKTCMLFTSSEAIKTSFYFTAIAYIAYTIASGQVEIAVFTTILTAYTVLSSKFNTLFKIDSDLVSLLYQSERIKKFYDHNSYIECGALSGTIPDNNQLAGIKIEFSHVTFHYPNNSDFCLKDFNLLVNPGETIAIVGLNGAGKSTLLKLLLRFYDVDSGEIRINDVNIRELNIKWLRREIGVAFQRTNIYAFSYKDNLELYNHKSEDQLEAAAKMMDVAIPKSQDNGNKNYCVEMTKYFSVDGISLSGGQAQKMAIARILDGEFGLRVFDEPTASLDPLSEIAIIRHIYKTSNHSTTVIVAHRLSTIVDADQIIVMDKGEIVEHGQHRELLNKGGVYSRMFRAQGEKYQIEESNNIQNDI